MSLADEMGVTILSDVPLQQHSSAPDLPIQPMNGRHSSAHAGCVALALSKGACRTQKIGQPLLPSNVKMAFFQAR